MKLTFTITLNIDAEDLNDFDNRIDFTKVKSGEVKPNTDLHDCLWEYFNDLDVSVYMPTIVVEQ